MHPHRWLALTLSFVLLGSVMVLHYNGPAPFVRTIGIRGAPLAAAAETGTCHSFVADGAFDTVSMLDARTATILRTVAVGSLPVLIRVDTRASRAFVLNAGDGSLSMLDTRTGDVIRTIRLRHPIDMAVDELSGHLFVMDSAGTPLGTVYTLDARTGMIMHNTTIDGEAGPMAVDSRAGRLFVLSDAQSTVSVLDTTTARLLRTVDTGAGPTAIAVDQRAAHGFVVNSTGSVSMFDTHSGAILHTTPVGPTPMSLAIDQRSGRVFVVDDRDRSVIVLDSRTGQRLNTVGIGGLSLKALTPQPSVGIVVDERGSHVFILRDGGRDRQGNPAASSVQVLDGTTGQLLRAFGADPSPRALALDQQRAQLLVLSARPSLPADHVSWLPWPARRLFPWLSRTAPSTGAGEVSIFNLSRL